MLDDWSEPLLVLLPVAPQQPTLSEFPVVASKLKTVGLLGYRYLFYDDDYCLETAATPTATHTSYFHDKRNVEALIIRIRFWGPF